MDTDDRAVEGARKYELFTEYCAVWLSLALTNY